MLPLNAGVFPVFLFSFFLFMPEYEFDIIIF